MRIWIAPLAWALVVSGPAAGEGPAASAPEPLTLAWCLARAAESNPELSAQEAGAAAARHRIAPA